MFNSFYIEQNPSSLTTGDTSESCLGANGHLNLEAMSQSVCDSANSSVSSDELNEKFGTFVIINPETNIACETDDEPPRVADAPRQMEPQEVLPIAPQPLPDTPPNLARRPPDEVDIRRDSVVEFWAYPDGSEEVRVRFFNPEVGRPRIALLRRDSGANDFSEVFQIHDDGAVIHRVCGNNGVTMQYRPCGRIDLTTPAGASFENNSAAATSRIAAITRLISR